MDQQCQSRGFAAPVDVLMDLGLLDNARYEDWRRGRVPYLEAVCMGNLHKLSAILKEMQDYARSMGWKESLSDYRQWGAKSRKLRFSKSGNPNVENAYATHYIGKKTAL